MADHIPEDSLRISFDSRRRIGRSSYEIGCEDPQFWLQERPYSRLLRLPRFRLWNKIDNSFCGFRNVLFKSLSNLKIDLDRFNRIYIKQMLVHVFLQRILFYIGIENSFSMFKKEF